MISERPIRLGLFEVTEPIGSGGMGEVWRGVHIAQDVPVAVKLISAERMEHPRFVTAFRNEVRAAAGLHHPGIVTLFDYGQVDQTAHQQSLGRLAHNTPFLAMELVSGGSLADLARPLAWSELRPILTSLLDALAHAHARGVIHRDLKPENVLLSSMQGNRVVKLTDFGIAHALDRHTRTAGTRHTTGASEVPMGTPLYTTFPNPIELERLNRVLFARFRFRGGHPVDATSWGGIAHEEYARTWRQLAEAFAHFELHQQASEMQDLATYFGPHP